MGLTVREGNESHHLGEAVDDSQGFGLAGESETLALKIHGVAGAGFIRGVRGKHTVG